MLKLIKPMISIGAAFVVFLTFAAIASAESSKTGVVTAEILNVRQNPNTTSKVLKKLPKGVQVSILSTSNGWYKITVKGENGWVMSQFVSIKTVKIPEGIINAANVNLRSAAGTSSKSKGQLAKGEKVTILRTTGDWSEVKTGNGKTGWVRKDLITLESDAASGGTTGKAGKDDPQKEQKSNTTALEKTANDAKSENKTEPAKNTGNQSNTNNMDNTNTTGATANDSPVNGQSSGTAIIYNPTDPTSTTTGQSITTTTGQSIVTTGQGILVNVEELITFAKSLQGVPYVYAGMTPEGFDCSGFTSYVFASFGVTLNRVAADQAIQGVEVVRDAMKPGDLVFFDSSGGHKAVNHVGIYIGEGKFIHASSGSSTSCVTISDITTGFYFDNFMTARSIFN